jgi:hypothetical protein
MYILIRKLGVSLIRAAGSGCNDPHQGRTESCREYYMGQGGGFPRVWAVVSQVSPS